MKIGIRQDLKLLYLLLAVRSLGFEPCPIEACHHSGRRREQLEPDQDQLDQLEPHHPNPTDPQEKDGIRFPAPWVPWVGLCRTKLTKLGDFVSAAEMLFPVAPEPSQGGISLRFALETYLFKQLEPIIIYVTIRLRCWIWVS